jgi:hypothetical protein
LLVLALFECAQRLARRTTPVAVYPFFIAALTVGLVVRLLYVTHVQPDWYTDFLTYWRTGITLASSDAIVVADIYDQRAFFLTRPLIEIFGPSKLALVVFNALLLSFIQLVGYDLVRRTRDHQTAQAFSLLWIAAPEPLLTTAIPNHDLAGLSLAAVALWLLLIAQSTRTTKLTLLCAAAGGAVLALLEVVRGLGILFCIVLCALFAAATIVQACRQGRAALGCMPLRKGALILLAVVISFGATLNLLAHAEVTVKPATATYLAIRYTTPHSTSLSDGTHRFYSGFDRTFTADLEQEVDRFARFRRALVLSDFIADPLSRIEASIGRMQRQYALGSQQNFYLRGEPQAFRSAASVYTSFFLLGFAVLLLLAIHRQLKAPLLGVSLAHFLLLFGAVTSMTLLLFGESQPRYLFILWFVGAIVIPDRADGRSSQTMRSPALLLTSAAAALGSLVLLLFLMASVSLREHNGRILTDWQLSNDLRDQAAGNEFLVSLQNRVSTVLVDPKGRAMPTAFGPLSLKLMLPQPPSIAHLAAAEKQICGVKPSAELEFQFHAPWKRDRGAFSLVLEANGQRIWRAPLPNIGKPERVLVKLPSDRDGCVRLKFSLNSHVAYSKASWQRASFVEIFFPRMVERSGN